MGEQKHTPGPWEQDGNQVRSTRGIIAICPVPQKGGVFDCNDNARLIAAALDMLALLKELIDIEGPQPGTGGWAGKVRATITQATGDV